MPTSKTIRHKDLEFATEAVGEPGNTPILMIMGATASMMWWPDEMCSALAAAGRFVIRYDNRDTGQSTTGEPGDLDYSIDDMANDAFAILDGYGVDAANIVGMSLGAMIGQLMALERPSRVLSLTAISSSRFDEDDPTLPEMDPSLLAHFGKMADLDWDDREAVLSFHAETWRISAGAGSNFDMQAAHALALREFDRARNPRSALNHSMLQGGEKYRGQVGRITAPTLVIHGRHDPILSLAHGERLAAAIPGARLVALDAGHELNPRDWPLIVSSIVEHTRPPRSGVAGEAAPAPT